MANEPQTPAHLTLIAERYEAAHVQLDEVGIPRAAHDDGPPLSLTARIDLLIHRPRRQCPRNTVRRGA